MNRFANAGPKPEAAPVDVLAVMDAAAERATTEAVHFRIDTQEACEMREARAAVAELTEAAEVLTDHITFRIDDPRAALLNRVVAAIARIGGAK